MMHSVEHRFVAIVCGAMLVFVAPLIVLFLYLSSGRIEREQLATAEIILDAGAKALAKPLWDFDTEALDRIAHALAADGNIAFVKVTGTSAGLSSVYPATDDEAAGTHAILSRDIVYDAQTGRKVLGTVELHVRSSGLFARFGTDELVIFSILIVAIAVVFIAAIVGNRITVIRPLLRLTAAIEMSRLFGSRQRVEWESDDEMGALVLKFNEMQSRLENEQNALRRAHARSTEIYNLTPAMLFSIDLEDRIVAVSNFWLSKTGYAREAVIDRPFSDFLDPLAHESYRDRRIAAGLQNTCEVTVPFLKANGETMSVLIQETMTLDHGQTEDAALAVMTDITALKQAESRNHVQAMTDHLTGLLNRQGFEAALNAGIRKADERSGELACVFIDLDRFKWINDNFGHAVGDEVLRQVVSRVRAKLRPEDTMSRIGGDEFAILINGENVEMLASDIGDGICASLAEPIVVRGTELSVSCSVGIALYPVHAENASDLLLKSDIAMYARKHGGKNGKQMFDTSMLDAARERHEIAQHIESGLREDWFEAYLQPIVGMSDGRIVGFEALMRLNHPEKGLLSPARIIGIAEETGTIGRVGERILEKAIGHLAAISRLEGTGDTYLAVNFSPMQFETTLPHKLAALLLKNHIAPSRIVIEITEAVLMLDSPDVHAVLKQLGEFGCRIALDDFGTGYSSLSYLNRFPVDIVKVDQSFTRSLTADEVDVRRKSRMLIKGIRTISNQMGYDTVAEGIETLEDWELLKKLGIDYGQGYFFSKPMPIGDMLRMLESNSEAKATTA
ncbi:diguanylate cyclase [Rhizobium sp. Leaf371]|uniref:putative bifunctional diguanylate cyclase/phosphodiesterase n=1 Tax=Rhizobium sp. Leaf371 TaxID=1736355 RepID=UPI000715BCCA|nr:bifunctional diguanylate cyclase/phosphodiesterase [Rhizobium sp. Leaf371]KQS72515.1 diguanylate cyclase [Rhizobium sp. Leaf371]